MAHDAHPLLTGRVLHVVDWLEALRKQEPDNDLTSAVDE